MQIETLKVYCDLVESCSFSQAAVRNFITQSAVSQQVKALERRFGTPLLKREGRSVSPTDAGRLLYDSSREILDTFERMAAAMQGVGEEMSGAVRVATVYSVGIYELSLVVKTFLKNYPRVRLHVEFSRANRVYEDCLKGTVDLGIVPYPKPPRGIKVIDLPADRLILICSPQHPFARRRGVRLGQLHGQNFIAFEKDIPSRGAIDQILEKHGVRVNVTMEFDNIETIKRSVEIGAGISIVPLASVQREVQSGSLVQLGFSGVRLCRPLGVLVKSRKSLSPAARKFVDLLHRPHQPPPK